MRHLEDANRTPGKLGRLTLASIIATVAAMAFAVPTCAQTEDTSIRPFRMNIPKQALVDLRRRVAATKFPERETVTDATQGVQLATMRALASYWATDYDWSKVEARLKALPQFVTTIDGLDIHFIHVRSKSPHALPLIITHGWPGSIIEQIKVIGPLTDPTAHGGKAEDSFDVVIPSLPGYGFSGKPTTPGWGPEHIARAWVVLMKRLGYTKFVAQGGDWGALITDLMGALAPPELLAIHTNMPGAVPNDINAAAFGGAPAPSGLAADEQHAYDQLAFFYKHGLGYAMEMANRPQTLYGIADSPVGLAAWILDHDAASEAMMARVFAGQSEGLTRDDILDNITLYWLTNTGVSSARLYWENKLAFFTPKNVAIPVAVSVFPDELYAAPRSWVEKAYPKLIHYNRLSKGTHFAAWEQPEFITKSLSHKPYNAGSPARHVVRGHCAASQPRSGGGDGGGAESEAAAGADRVARARRLVESDRSAPADRRVPPDRGTAVDPAAAHSRRRALRAADRVPVEGGAAGSTAPAPRCTGGFNAGSRRAASKRYGSACCSTMTRT